MPKSFEGQGMLRQYAGITDKITGELLGCRSFDAYLGESYEEAMERDDLDGSANVVDKYLDEYKERVAAYDALWESQEWESEEIFEEAVKGKGLHLILTSIDNNDNLLDSPIDADDYVTEMAKKPLGVNIHPKFMKEWSDLGLQLSDLAKVKAFSYQNPDADWNKFIPELDSHYFRWGIDDKGGLRIIHKWIRRTGKMALIACYAKNDSRLTSTSYPKSDEIKRLGDRIKDMERKPLI